MPRFDWSCRLWPCCAASCPVVQLLSISCPRSALWACRRNQVVRTVKASMMYSCLTFLLSIARGPSMRHVTEVPSPCTARYFQFTLPLVICGHPRCFEALPRSPHHSRRNSPFKTIDLCKRTVLLKGDPDCLHSDGSVCRQANVHAELVNKCSVRLRNSSRLRQDPTIALMHVGTRDQR